jgi:hypothetical protein
MRPRVRFLAATGALGALACALFGSAGCAADEEVPDTFAVNTAISVTPNEFLLGVPCSPGAGAMKSYVAVITDRGLVDADGNTPPGYAFELPASGPTPCTDTVAFRYVVVGHRYEARVHAFDIPAAALTPSVANCAEEDIDPKDPTKGKRLVRAPGSTLLCWNPTGVAGAYEIATPDWTRSCGTQGFGAAVAKSSTEVRVRGCVAEGDNGNVGVGETVIRVDPMVALAPQMVCLPKDATDRYTPEPHEIDSFDVLPEDAGLPDTVGVDCESGVAAEYTDVEPGAAYRFRVEAGNAEFPARWATSCDAVAFEGVAVTASCDTLTDRGTVRLELADCPLGATYHLRATDTDTGEQLTLGDGNCPGPATISSILSGRYDVVATIEVPEAEPNELTCSATVVPAAITTVECTDPTPASGD